MRKLIILTFGIFFSILLNAQTALKDSYDKALKLYEEKKYSEAIVGFENTLKNAKTENVLKDRKSVV